MSIAASAPLSVELQLRVPAEFAKTKARKMILWLLIYVMVIEVSFIAYDFHIGHERFTHDGFVLVLACLWQPWISLSNDHWVYIVNEKGIFLRDTSQFSSSNYFNLITWSRYHLLSLKLDEWRDYPSLEMKFIHKGRECTKIYVFRHEEEIRVREQLMPWLIAKFPTATYDVMLAG